MCSSPNIRTPPTPPPVPEPVDRDVLQARDEQRRRARARYGLQSTLLTGPQGAQGSPKLGYPTLTGPQGS